MRTQSVPGLRDVQCLESTFALPLDVSVCPHDSHRKDEYLRLPWSEHICAAVKRFT
jgi:hypothetical protein